MDRHEQQFAFARGGNRQREQPAKNSGNSPSCQCSQPGQSDGGTSTQKKSQKSVPGQPARDSGRNRGCFNCSDLNHLRRNCPNNKLEASRRSGVGDLSTQCGGQGNKSVTGDMAENCTPEEESVRQLEQLLATMRLNMEKSKLQKANVGTVVADQVTTRGGVGASTGATAGYHAVEHGEV